MATAREQLFNEVVALAKNPADDGSEKLIADIMLRYRVQTKPGVVNDEGKTARDTLGARILRMWKEAAADFEQQVGTEIDNFRMQSKAKSKSTKKPKPKPVPAETVVLQPPPSVRAQRAPPPDPRKPQPVGGGPRMRNKKARSECPKCHSNGVVLAKSYAGDEYFSCIYCGWQAFQAADDLASSASLAGRLLGHTTKPK